MVLLSARPPKFEEVMSFLQLAEFLPMLILIADITNKVT